MQAFLGFLRRAWNFLFHAGVNDPRDDDDDDGTYRGFPL